MGAPTTPPSLLFRLRDSHDRDAWHEFVALYGPAVYRFGRKRGLQDADALDLMQVVFQAVAGAVERFEYDPQRGKFRGWLFGVVRHQLGKLLDRQRRAPPGEGGTPAVDRLREQPERDSGEAELWAQEYRRQRFRWAAEKVHGDFEESSWQAFWRTAVEGRSGTAVAQELGLSPGAVSTAKSRVLARIRDVLAKLQDE
jgi:RNA polymerase sigma-70 factor (ECF subfamily)